VAGKEENIYVWDDAELKTVMERFKGRRTQPTVQRFKGLGEMNPEQLAETTLDMDKRTVKRVIMDDAVTASGLFSVLMGDKVEPRKLFIETHAHLVGELDV
jgi:DNA gyrase subunit B